MPRFNKTTPRPTDLICMGRIAADFYAEQIYSPLEAVKSFNLYLGGCPANISVGTSRLGLNVRMLSHVGTDDMGRFLRNTLVREGVDTSLLVDDPDHLTAIVILGINPPDRFPLIFHRENCADMQITEADIDPKAFEQAKACLLTGTGLSTESMRRASFHAVEIAKNASCAIVFDIDYRPVLWNLTNPGDGESRYVSAPEVSKHMQALVPHCDLIVGTEEEVLCAGGCEEIEDAIKVIQDLSSAPIVLKRGEKGCLIYDPSEPEPIECEAFPVEVLNVLGAGDGFLSGFLRGWLRDEPWQTCGRYGNANGALVVSRHGCAPAMASFEELEYFMAEHPKDPKVLTSARLDLLHRHCTLGKAKKFPLQTLAFDHRIQFEDTCREAGKDLSVIADFKAAVFAGFKKVAQAGHSKGALLIDPIYGQPSINEAVESGILTGLPIEASGVHPIEWIDGKRSLYQQILERPAALFVKVLWKYHPDMPEAERAHQIQALRELGQVCQRLERRLMLELIIPPEYDGSAASVCSIMDTVYGDEVFPFWWKIAAQPTTDAWQKVCQTMESYDPEARIVVLGLGAEMDSLKESFKTVRSSHHSNGFAIGRTIFQPAWEAYLAGSLTLEQVTEQIAERYRSLIDAWEASE